MIKAQISNGWYSLIVIAMLALASLIVVIQPPHVALGQKPPVMTTTTTVNKTAAMTSRNMSALPIISLREGHWRIKANGFQGDLNIASVDNQGRLSGTLTMQNEPTDQIVGFWDERSEKIIFMRILNPSDPSAGQIYTGHLFCIPIGCSSTGQNTLTLAGSFEALATGGGSAERSVFGWYAEVTIVG
jgi:hypothetical protein